MTQANLLYTGTVLVPGDTNGHTKRLPSFGSKGNVRIRNLAAVVSTGAVTYMRVGFYVGSQLVYLGYATPDTNASAAHLSLDVLIPGDSELALEYALGTGTATLQIDVLAEDTMETAKGE